MAFVQKLFAKIIQFLCAILLLAFSLVYIILLFSFFAPLKLTVFLCARIFRKDVKRFMGGLSSLYASRENICKRPRSNLCVSAVFNGPIEISRLRQLFQTRVLEKTHHKNSKKGKGTLMYPELHQYWTSFLNYRFWTADKNFDLKNHVRLYDFGHDTNEPAGCSQPLTENDLCKIMGPLLEQPWTPGRSPWEILVLQNFNSCRDKHQNQGGTVLIFRLHHALGDGYSILKLALRDLMLSPLKFNINFPRMSKCQNIGLWSILPFKLAWDLAGSVSRSAEKKNCWLETEVAGSTLTAFSKPIDMNFIKKIKNKHGVGYNSVLCAVAVRSCQKLMKEAGQTVPQAISCVVPVPLPNHPDGLTNHFTQDYLKLPLNPYKKLSPAENLQIVSCQMTRSPYYMAPLGWSLLIKSFSFLPNSAIAVFKRGSTSIALTSFTCHENAPVFNGLNSTIKTNLVDMFVSAGGGCGQLRSLVALTSLNGRQRFTLSIDKAVFPNEDVLQKWDTFIQEELDDLWNIQLDKERENV